MDIRVIERYGKEDLAYVYLAEINKKGVVEFVESLQPPIPREQKWVLIVSVSYGCPVKCIMCDAKIDYKGNLTADEIMAQIDYMVLKRFPYYEIHIPKFKIQFARMGEPSFNVNVLEVLKNLPKKYKAEGLTPCVSTIAPERTDKFFEELYKIKEEFYQGRFQLQLSMHSTDNKRRDEIMPVKKWTFEKIAQYGKKFKGNDKKKITLNFVAADSYPVDLNIMKKYFDPDIFLVKITPLNPTISAVKNNLTSYINPLEPAEQYDLIEALKQNGYDVILSIGENEENHIGSNCGQYVTEYLNNQSEMENAYKTNVYQVKE